MGEKGIGRKLMVMRVPAPATMPGKMGWPAGRARRRGEGGFFNAGLLPGGHEARKVLRVREEGEDVLDGVREPLLGLEVMTHRG